MMHLNEGDRAVRFSGNWKDQKESMPDCYLSPIVSPQGTGESLGLHPRWGNYRET